MPVNRSEVIYVRVPAPLKRALEEEAATERRSIASQLGEILRDRYPEVVAEYRRKHSVHEPQAALTNGKKPS